MYPEPHTFNPARFLDKDGRIDPSVEDPETRVFGSDRRFESPRYVFLLLKSSVQQDLPRTLFGSPNAVPYDRACTRNV